MTFRRGAAVQVTRSVSQHAPERFGNTIVSVAHPVALKSLCVEEANTVGPRLVSEQKVLKIRLADNEGHCDAAGLLVKRRYAWRGYDTAGVERTSPDRVTFSAWNSEAVVATISIGIDSSGGLFVDKLYAREVEAIRAAGAKLCEFTKLAIEASLRSKPILAALFHIAYIHARRINHCCNLLVEVNPRHVAFYEQMLGFAVCGGEKLDSRVNAPAILMRLDLAHAERQIAKMGGRLDLGRSIRSLYPYFFGASEETAVERRLRSMS